MARDRLAEVIETTFKEGRRSGLSIAAAADLVADALRRHLEQERMEEGEVDADLIHMQSIFGYKTGMPMVDFQVGFEHFSLPVAKAREHALAILQVAEAASQDAAVYRWLTLSDLGLDARAAAHAVGELRRFRGDAPKEDWRTPEQQLTDKDPNDATR